MKFLKNAFVRMISKVSIYMFIFLMANPLSSNNTLGQSLEKTKVSIFLNEATVVQIFKIIEKQSSFYFVYDSKISQNTNRISFNDNSISVRKVLEKISREARLKFKRINQSISVNIIPEKEVEIAIAIVREISGKVTDQNGEPLPGVNILVKGTNIGTSTDFDGNFTLEIPDDNAVLVVSYVGYKTREIAADGKSNFDVKLEEDARALDEVVVVGYGTQSKRAITGAVSSISGEELGETPNDSFSRALSGKIAGVQIKQTTGTPGGNIVVRVRGTGSLSAGNDPLYVIDGFPIEQSRVSGPSDQGINPLSAINPDDIESIQVLKDASASAIYGSRGSNGVILITTKRGKSGDTKLNFSVTIGSQSVINKIDLLNSGQFLDFVREAYVNADATSSPGIQFPEFLNNESQLRGVDTDWQDQIFRPALVKNYQLSGSGGTEKFQYFISGGYLDEEGIILSSGYKRFSLLTNLDVQLTDQLKLGINLTPSYTLNDEVNAEGHWAGNAVINQSLINFPFLRIDESSEDFVNNDPNFNCCGVPNPVHTAKDFDAESTLSRLLTNSYLELDILEGLKAKTSIGYDYTDFERNEFNPAKIRRNTNDNSANSTKKSQRSWLSETTLNYTKTLGNHNIVLLGGFSYQEFREQNNYMAANGLTNDIIHTINDFNTVITANSFIQEWSLVSLLGRLNYSYKDKYYMTVAVRRDGSSRFGVNNKYATFPSVSGGWVISEEDFLKESYFLNQLKFRASYGKTGNNRIGNYSSIGLLGNSNYVLGSGNGVSVTGLQPSSIGNPDLTWETTSQYDIGLEFGLYKNRISLVADYFNSETKDLLLRVPVPASSGFSSSLQNLGRIRNTGWEFTVTSKNFVGDFKWDTNFNISFGTNEILELGPEGDPIRGGSGAGKIFLNEIGGELGSFSVYEQIGIFQTQEEINSSATWDTGRGTYPGDIIYKDQNGDGVINSDDRVVIGSNKPDFIWGITNNFYYKNFDLNIVINGVEGNLIHNVARRFYNNLEGNQNQSTDALNRWKSLSEPGDGITPRANRLTTGNNNVAESSRWVEDGSFIRIQNVTFGYNFPTSITKKMGISSLRLYGSVSNLAYFTDYSGYNPEVSLSGGSPLSSGADYGSYPLSRRFSLGLKIGL